MSRLYTVLTRHLGSQVTTTWAVLGGTAITLVLLLVYFISNTRHYGALSKIPGPTLAKFGEWYEIYYDIILGGRQIEKLEELHAKYGPYVRISGREVHTVDVEAFKTVFGPGYRFIKAGAPSASAHQMIINGLFGLREPEAVKARKNILRGQFSKSNISKLQNVFEEKLTTLRGRYDEFADCHTLTNLSASLQGLTVDLLGALLLDNRISALSSPTFSHPMLDSSKSRQDCLHFFRHFPNLAGLVLKIPPRIVTLLSPEAGDIMRVRDDLERTIKGFRTNYEEVVTEGHAILLQQALDPKSEQREGVQALSNIQLRDEFFTILVGGVDTVAFAIVTAIWFLSENTDVKQKLMAELEDVVPKNDKFANLRDLEGLPYLTAVLKESLRIGGVSPGKLLREVPAGGAYIGKRFFPGGSHISMSPNLFHLNESIFPNARQFQPERWLGEQGRQLDQYNFAFGKGSRTCLGMNIAWSLLYQTVAMIFGRYDVQVAETTAWDMEYTETLSARPNGSLKAYLSRR